MAFTLFHTTATDPASIGRDALLFILMHDHTISVPDSALPHAEKAAVIAIARRDVSPVVLTRVNRAIDIIAGTIRRQLALGTQDAPAVVVSAPVAPASRGNAPVRPMVPVAPVRPSGGLCADPF